MEFSTRSARLHSNPMGMLGVPPRGPGARGGKRIGLAGILATAGTSVVDSEKGHMATAPMVRCQICKKYTRFLRSYLNGPIL